MARKPYDWAGGAVLEEHSRRKLKILREYFFQYIAVRCRIPQQEKFRLAVVDGFSGAGRYSCGTGGSPVVFLEELPRALEAINLQRSSQGIAPVDIDCLLILNDAESVAVELLKENCTPLLAAIKENCSRLRIDVQYMNREFEQAYPSIKATLGNGRYRNVLFNLDQCGHSEISIETLQSIMRSANSVEIFYTFAIEALLAFLSRTNPSLMSSQLQHLGIDGSDLRAVERGLSNNAWLGAAEKLVFEVFQSASPFVSPFSINNPAGWRYWLIHFANNYRARQVYNNILHDNSSSQAHFGRSGLNMLSYNPDDERGLLYLFDSGGRKTARDQLLDDIPRLLSETGDAIGMGEFYESIYNATPAHKDDIHTAIIESSELEVVTPSGGTRQKGSTIGVDDTLKLKSQTSFYPMFRLRGSKTKT